MFDIQNNAGFTDGGGKTVRSLDVVEYRFGLRRGILMEALQDGDAYVAFRDTKQIELVKWTDLCKVPEFSSLDRATGNPIREFNPTHKHKNGNLYEVVYKTALLQTQDAVSDETPVLVYMNEHGRVWVRPQHEFDDGRFTRL